MKPDSRVMVIGAVGAGKTTLLQALKIMKGEKEGGKAKKTQDVSHSPEAIDTPGEFLGMTFLLHALISSSAKASVVLFIADPTRPQVHPGGFARSLKAPVLGVVTKIDLASGEQVERAERNLKMAGVREILKVSSQTGQGLDELQQALVPYRGKTGEIMEKKGTRK